MSDPSRRELLAAAVAPGLVPDDPPKPAAKTDRDFVLAAGKFFGLPVLHPSDAAEVAQAIHVVQTKLLARPTYRKYLELAKAAKK